MAAIITMGLGTTTPNARAMPNARATPNARGVTTRRGYRVGADEKVAIGADEECEG